MAKQQKLRLLPVLEAGKFKTKVLAGFLSSEAALLGLQMASSLGPHMAFPLCVCVSLGSMPMLYHLCRKIHISCYHSSSCKRWGKGDGYKLFTTGDSIRNLKFCVHI